MEHNNSILVLPVGAVGRLDVGRLLREAEALDEFLTQAAVREPGTALKLPKTSKLLDDMLTSNKLNGLVVEDRQRIISFLQSVKGQAPTMHISFSADPSPLFVQRLVSYLRAEIHPLVLLQIGLQPNIGAGCVVRTTNKYFDFSLRQRFKENRGVLMSKLQGLPDKKPETPVPVAVGAPTAPEVASV
ncbi:MAG: hypothetical protein JWL85_610 [Candidatus Saccharibacteria bacterium]|nr:hypothetical protein [Candidatus Saccharibacteria bacterium]